MGVDQTSLDRIRNATFPSSRRGYDKHEVEKFLARLADWLETGGGDESRSDTVKRELERVGERTGAILSQAQDSAQQIRAEAEEEARSTLNEANATAQKLRSEADAYAGKTRGEADAYAAETRSAIDSEAAEHRDRLDGEVEEALVEAESKARRIVEEGLRRREDIESVITDLVHRRDEVIADVDDLSAKLDAAASEHRPRGPDPYERPLELDPEVRGEEADEGPGVDDDIDIGEHDD
ncbi:MAG TPA: DivIVA domain-containing protein, partial [Solirubrobacterales bacterium]|nr:DivIVA domain-containing protein [Solirubrobacterales bacterium]